MTNQNAQQAEEVKEEVFIVVDIQSPFERDEYYSMSSVKDFLIGHWQDDLLQEDLNEDDDSNQDEDSLDNNNSVEAYIQKIEDADEEELWEGLLGIGYTFFKSEEEYQEFLLRRNQVA
ncbi:hypothetical protein SFC65_19265 [Priestia filamentosa]|uniref:hypothetical protein n=1 Tax=Priestia filamentosa TaxID=1402861 RepID=UPI00398240C3